MTKEDIKDAILRGAKLIGVNLRGVDFTGVDFEDADFTGIDFTGIDFTGIDLTGIDFTGADFRGAIFRGAKLRGVNFRGADLEDANIENCYWIDMCKQNILYIFNYVPDEVASLRDRIINGRINGTQYEGDCCCLIGSLGNEKAVNVIPYYQRSLLNYGEQLFYQIQEGDTPETNQFSKIALDLCDEFLSSKTTK